MASPASAGGSDSRPPVARKGCLFGIPENEYIRLADDLGGVCLLCGAEAYGVEPDARRYRCESCNLAFVYGAEELLMMGRIEFLDPAQAEQWRNLTEQQREAGYQRNAIEGRICPL